MEIPTKCETCNRVLESDLGKDGACYVELCPDCEKAEKKISYDDGYAQGQADMAKAKNESYAEGYDWGYKDRAGRNP
ncbi:unnamed protein product [marine sediment metagenome]|uniref:Uncharacterized protein n=1 Tax=marine sediment metagenome TaxID=412755 RepID=X1D2W9_9ZZZZ